MSYPAPWVTVSVFSAPPHGKLPGEPSLPPAVPHPTYCRLLSILLERDAI